MSQNFPHIDTDKLTASGQLIVARCFAIGLKRLRLRSAYQAYGADCDSQFWCKQAPTKPASLAAHLVTLEVIAI